MALDHKIAANTHVASLSEALLTAEFDRLGADEPTTRDAGCDLADLVELNPGTSKPGGDEPVYLDMQKLPTAGMLPAEWEYRPAKGGARFMNGDTLVARITPCLENRKTGYVNFLQPNEVGLGSTEYVVLRAKPGVPPAWAFFLATSERFRTFAIGRMTGTSGRQRVSAAGLRDYEIARPNAAALARFGDRATPTVALLGSLRDENRELAATRDALLPELMSGRLRVRDAESVVEAT